MKKVTRALLGCFIFTSLVGTGAAWADPGEKKFLPPGLQKKNKQLPPPFQSIAPTRTLKAKIIFLKTISEKTWLVVENGKRLNVFSISNNSQLAVGDTVKIQYVGDRAISVQRISSQDKDEDAAKKYEHLSYSLSLDPKKAVLGKDISFELTVKNETEEEIAKQITSGKIYDFVVKKDGIKQWQWSDNRHFITLVQTLVFKEGDKTTYSVSWRPSAIGAYTVEAYFLGESDKPVALGTFEITPE